MSFFNILVWSAFVVFAFVVLALIVGISSRSTVNKDTNKEN